MKNLKKKGFTIVELVIVIAVIAVLAAVLIPTFVSLTKKAQMNSDQVAVKQMNTVLATEFLGKKPESLKEVVDALDENGYNVDSLIPLSKGYAFVWNKDTNTISLVLQEEIQDNENLENGVSYINVEVSTADEMIAELGSGKDVTLTEDINLGIGQIIVPNGANVDIDLNGKTLSNEMRDDVSHNPAISNNGIMTIKGDGTITSRGVYNYGTLTIEDGVNINAIDSNGGGAIWGFSGSKTIINGGTFKALNGDGGDLDPVLIYVDENAEVEVNGGYFEGNAFTYGIKVNGGKLTINDGTFIHTRGCLAADSGTVMINGGTFEVTTGDFGIAHVIYSYNGSIIIKGGTFTNNNNGNIFDVELDGSGSITLPDGTVLKPGEYR